MRTDKENRASYKRKKEQLADTGTKLGLTYKQWLGMWEQSGNLEEMKSRDKVRGYVMTRIDKLLPYTADNVEIVTSKVSEERGKLKHGEKHREDSKKKMAKSHTGKKFTEEHRANMSAAQQGSKKDEATKKKISEAMKARHAKKKQQKKG